LKIIRFRSGIIQCLAKLMLHDVLRKANLLSSDCEDELKFELLQRVSIEFFEINHVAFFFV